jgi:ComF family protein
MSNQSTPQGRAEFSTAHLRPFAALRVLMQALAGTRCLVCQRPGGSDIVCAGCEPGLPDAGTGCPQCALPGPPALPCPSCREHRPAFDRTIALYRYEAPVDRLLRGLKFGGQLAFASWVADRLACRAAAPGGAPARSPGLLGGTRPRVLVPVPLSSARLRERGYNQAHEITRHLRCRVALDWQPGALARVRTTRAQARLSADERHRNLQDAFSGDRGRVAGRAVIVVDDVMTTGATLEACASALKAAGAISVDNWVVARALRHEPSAADDAASQRPQACSRSSSSSPRFRPTAAT